MEGEKEEHVVDESQVLESISGTDSTTTASGEIVTASSAENKLTSKQTAKHISDNGGGTCDVLNLKMDGSKVEIGFKLPQLPLLSKTTTKSKQQSKSDGKDGNASFESDTLSKSSPDKNRPYSNTQQEAPSPSSQLTMQTSLEESTKLKDDDPAEDQTDKKEMLPVKDEQMADQKSDSTKEVSFAAPSLPPKHSKLRGSLKPPIRDPTTNTSGSVNANEPDSDNKMPLTHDSVTDEKSGIETDQSTVKMPRSKERTCGSSNISKLSPAEKIAQAVPVPYKEPSWAGVPQQPYHLEVLKGGAILSNIPLNEKSFHVFGRLESCDVMLEHPSLSRFHMVLQYRLIGDSDNDPGFYVYDLDSTHGSFLNKKKLKPKTYCRMRVGHMFKLAGSTRLYVLQGPAEDQEADSGLSIAELKYLREKQLAEREQLKVKEKEEKDEKQRQEEEAKGISWGMDDDDEAEEEDPAEENPFALMSTEERESLYIKDPKKTLRGFFEREGFELEYDVEEQGIGHTRQYICRVELPIDDADGRPITAEAAVGGKKKEAVVACALEACRILDAQGVLRQAKHESKKRKAKNWADDDYYDSDDDTFLDRTGEIEKKRKARMKKAGVIKDEVETFASLTAKVAKVEADIKKIDDEIATINNTSAQTPTDDSLDAFMSSIKSGTVLDKTRRAKLKIQKIELKKEQAKLMKLINVARPASLPEIKRKLGSSKTANNSSSASTKKLPMIGSIKGRLGAKKFKFVMPVAKPVVHQVIDDMVEEEEEEEEEEDVPMETSTTVPQGDKAEKDLPGSSSVISSGDAKVTEQTDAQKDMPTQQGLQTAPVKGPQRPPSKEEPKTAPSKGPQRPSKGPQRPPSDDLHTAPSKGPQRAPSAESQTAPSKGPQRGPSQGPSKSDFQQYLGNDDDEDEDETAVPVIKKKPTKIVAMETEDDVTDWAPPKGQTGDGRTSLNDKYGY